MNKDQLGQSLDQLDPGGRLSIDRVLLAEVLGTPEGAYGPAAERFAEEHGCTFADDEDDGEGAHFVKNDVF